MHRQSDNALVFMAKWPQPGRAKTRLCPPLTPAEAADLARAFLLDTLAEASCTDADLFLAYAPAGAAADFRLLAGLNVGLIPAEAPHLGLALREGQRAALAMGYRRVALVGSDLPHLSAARYAEAFEALDCADVVIGPSGDGGYYLLATAHETPALFENIAWSTSVVHRQTQDRAAAAGLRLETISACDDVDTAEDLPFLLDVLRHHPGAGHTLRLLEQLPLSPNPLHHEGRGGFEQRTVSHRAERARDGRGSMDLGAVLHRGESRSPRGRGTASEASRERGRP